MGSSALVSVGDELLEGRIVDTNAAWISARLRSFGLPVVRRETVPDQEEAISEALLRLRGRFSLVVITGGLGPTPDDLTRAGVARGLSQPLEPSASALELIRTFFSRRGRRMAEREAIQGMLPHGAEALPNAKGTAPGFLVRQEGLVLAVLPGVPDEMRSMLEEQLLPRLEGLPGREAPPVEGSLTLAGIPESRVGELLSDLMQRGRNPSIGSYPRVGQVLLVIRAHGTREKGARELLQEDLREIKRRMGPHVLGEGRLWLHEVAGRRLLKRGLTLAVAESLTGGLISERLVAVPGISAVFRAGLVTYSNEAKQAVLGVQKETLKVHGAVSKACAREMALGARRVAGTDLALSTTGIAGPGGGTSRKPVGTVFLGLADPGGVVVEERHLLGDREQIRERTACWAFDALRRWLQGHQKSAEELPGQDLNLE